MLCRRAKTDLTLSLEDDIDVNSLVVQVQTFIFSKLNVEIEGAAYL